MNYFLSDLSEQARWCLDQSKIHMDLADKTPWWRFKKKRRHLEAVDLLQDEAEDIINEMKSISGLFYG